MTFIRSVIVALLSTLTVDATAQTRPERELISEPVQGFAYYNLPGATRDEHDAAYRDCFVATQVRPNTSVYNPFGGLAAELVWGGVIQAIGVSAVENCMIARGWRVFQLPEDQGRAVARLSDDAFMARFETMVGAETPPGTLAREWSNQTSRPATYHTPSRARPPSKDQLSIRSFRLRKFEVTLRSADEALEPAYTEVRGVPLARFQPPGPGKAVVIVGAVGNRGMRFSRTTGSGGGIAFGISGSREGAWQAFEIPAGRYRIARTSWILHCLGAPAFDVQAGEVVYAGTFDLAGDDIGPDLDISNVTGRLASVSGPVRVAGYQNGSIEPCPYGMGIYPLEISGAPFEPGYHWGSLAPRSTRSD